MVQRPEDAEHRSERLKERVYVTFTALAVVLAVRTHPEPPDEVALTLVIVVSGTLLASLLAEVVAHIAVRGALPSRDEFGHSLRAASIALVAALVAIGYLAARRVQLPWWQRAMVLFGEFVVGALVLGLELLAHA